MTGLSSLPAELLYAIFDYLQPLDEVHPLKRLHTTFDPDKKWDYQNSYSTLAKLARVCKLFTPIATETLYKHLWVPYMDQNPAVSNRLARDHVARQAVKHIRVLQRGPHCEYGGRSKEEIKAHLRQLPVLTRDDAKPLLDKDRSQLEVAILIAHAPNLETLSMKSYSESDCTSNDQVPFWLLPIVDAGRGIFHNPNGCHAFERLHTLSINMQSHCSTDLAYLFCLPRLRRLRLQALGESPWKNTVRFEWPVLKATSGLLELNLEGVDVAAEVVVHMLHSCEALLQFECHRDDPSDTINHIDDSRAWCAKVLAAVRRHQASLKHLELRPYAEYMISENMFSDYEPLEDFREFWNLEVLAIPFLLLMGRPSHGASYPQMRDVLPPNLTTLRLGMHPEHSYGADAETILSCVRADTDPAFDSSLSVVELRYDGMYGWYTTLPMDFWEIKNVLLQHGISFEYTLCNAVEYDCRNFAFVKEHIEEVAQGLSAYGMKGVEMAAHFCLDDEERPIDQLVEGVFSILNLDKDKPLTQKERNVLFLAPDHYAINLRDLWWSDSNDPIYRMIARGTEDTSSEEDSEDSSNDEEEDDSEDSSDSSDDEEDDDGSDKKDDEGSSSDEESDDDPGVKTTDPYWGKWTQSMAQSLSSL
jgi:hypothetical protein